MSTPHVQARPSAFDDAVEVPREVAGHERGHDERRADISAAVAALVDACGRRIEILPPDVADRALAVVGAVDRAAGLGR